MIVRRHFSYEPGAKIFRNSVFRLFSRTLLGRQYRVTDFLFSLPPFAPPERMQPIFNLAQSFVVEVETHPINPEEYRFLTEGDVLRCTNDCPPAPSFGNSIALQHVKESVRAARFRSQAAYMLERPIQTHQRLHLHL